MRQSNDNNVCPSCGERFRSSRAFDMHRTGSYGVWANDGTYQPANRRCKTAEEMTEAGMGKNRRGLWITKPLKLPLHMYQGAADKPEVMGR